MDGWEGAQLNTAKEILAYELTKLVHGEEEAEKAKQAARALFGSGENTDNMPSTELSEADFAEDLTVLDLLTKCSLIPSRKEGRRLIQQGGVSLDGEKVSDPFFKVTKEMFAENGYVVIKKGKKVFRKAVLK